MSGVLFIVSMDPVQSERLAQPLRDRGWSVELKPADTDAICERAGACRPVAMVVPLDPDPDAACDLACSLSVAAVTESVPVVFVGGSAEDRAAALAARPDATFVDDGELPWRLKQLSLGN